MKLFCATTNPGKVREFRMAAEHFGFPEIEIDLLPGLKSVPAPEENGASFGDNAVEKAVYYSRLADLPVFADDSGLEVDALGGEPGVYSARYAGPGCSDADNNRLLRERLKDKADRTARFVCVIALAEKGRLLGAFRGAVDGRIIDEERGARGFGYDPMFLYEPFGLTFGEATDEQKLGVSHRGQALRAMLASLAQRPDGR